ncbi:MAG: Eco57I restriction-modification methylase domain-containing protein, partial [Bacteroidota bacterium]|nr:Eco57I restriction-modification methylase domain-containing protein [Bacteroidota bacterium]
MPLFQQAVLTKYLAQQDKVRMAAAYEAFKLHFHNAGQQERIRNLKEEQYQEGFLRDLFVNILGYKLNPQEGFELTTEFKNEKGSRKADGAILKDGKALAVIELKGTDTTDLGTINTQAFNYKANHTHCVYVITSNFEKLRFFIDNAVEWIEFDLFNLTYEQFQLLWLCLLRDNLIGGLPKKVKAESVQEEEKITKDLYKDYSAFKNALWQDLVKNHPDLDPLLLYKKTQKLLDRFLFILFSEDKQLLEPNTLKSIIADWRKLRDLDEYRPLYERCQKYFGYLNTGYKSDQLTVFAYNGGLFKADEVLDTVRISDQLLEEHLKTLFEYDFASEVDVNILGHIFEHSLNEIEAITAQLEGRATDARKSKRKKDGVFYTPKYITKYIVENTVGRLCKEKKDELALIEEEYARERKGRSKKSIGMLDTKLEVYRQWLLGLTICDPACGSGAFLNEALNFLIAEHRYVDELQAKLLGHSIRFIDIGDHILERNIHGVDINEESVEIAKLSLWLRTATRGRKLNDLSGNIKCGNSLISDPAVAGNKAFDWQKEFPQVFDKGGFDVVIGNPPYLRVQGLRENFELESKFFEKNFKTATGRFDIYVLFIERSYGLVGKDGRVSFILPHKFLVSDFGHGTRQWLLDNKATESLIHFGSNMVFDDASTYTCILTLSKDNDAIRYKQLDPSEVMNPTSFETLSIVGLSSKPWNLQGAQSGLVLEKIHRFKTRVSDIFRGVFQGVVSGDNKAFYLADCHKTGNRIEGYSEAVGARVSLEASICKQVVTGKEIGRYGLRDSSNFIIYPYRETDKGTTLIPEDQLVKEFPECYKYFNSIRQRLETRGSQSMAYPTWYSLWNFRSIGMLESPKILTPDVCYGGSMYYDEQGQYYFNDTSYGLILKAKNEDYWRWLAILNSSVCWYYLQSTSSELRGGYFRFKSKYVLPFPLPELQGKPAEELSKLARSRSNDTSAFNELRCRVVTFMALKLNITKATKNLENWPSLDFKAFLQELKKLKISLSLSEEAEWMGYFNEQKAKAQALQAQ